MGDDVALRLKNEPNSKLVIVGFADPKEPKAAKLAETRAELAKKYLGEKGIDASRISTRAGTASTEKGMEKDNRRVDFSRAMIFMTSNLGAGEMSNLLRPGLGAAPLVSGLENITRTRALRTLLWRARFVLGRGSWRDAGKTRSDCC